MWHMCLSHLYLYSLFNRTAFYTDIARLPVARIYNWLDFLCLSHLWHLIDIISVQHWASISYTDRDLRWHQIPHMGADNSSQTQQLPVARQKMKNSWEHIIILCLWLRYKCDSGKQPESKSVGVISLWYKVINAFGFGVWALKTTRRPTSRHPLYISTINLEP